MTCFFTSLLWLLSILSLMVIIMPNPSLKYILLCGWKIGRAAQMLQCLEGGRLCSYLLNSSLFNTQILIVISIDQNLYLLNPRMEQLHFSSHLHVDCAQDAEVRQFCPFKVLMIIVQKNFCELTFLMKTAYEFSSGVYHVVLKFDK